MKKSRKIIAILLTVLTLMSVISAATPVFAAEVTEISETQSEDATTGNSEPTETEENAEEQTATDEPEPLNEMVEWRTENTKYFRNSDGSYTAAQYAYPIHYKEDGEWKEIDNTLTEKTLKDNTFSEEKEFVADKTDRPVKFPDEFKKDGSKEITVSADGYEISFSPKTSLNLFKKTEGSIKDKNELESTKIVGKFNEKQSEKLTASKELKAIDKAEAKEEINSIEKINASETKKNNRIEKFKVENKSGAVAYENVFDNADLEYELNNSQIKESIVVNEKRNNYVFEFNMNLGGLYPIVCQNGSINLCSDEEGKNPVAKIESPYMVDSNGEYSDAVTMTIKADGENYILTVTADENWLNDKARAYPVVIDPTIRLDIDTAHTYDCYVDNSKPSDALPYDTWLYVGNNSYGKTRSFVKFDLPALPGDNYLITNATVSYHQYEIDPGNGSDEFMAIYEVLEDWDNKDYNVTWNNQPDFDGDVVLDYAKFFGANDGKLYEYQFDVTRTVKEWYEGADNFGFALKLKDETATKRARLVSAEHPVDNYYPSIYVTFLDNKGLESYWSYSSYSIGSAGNAYINDYTGNLVYELPILSSISERFPLTLTAYFNNYCANTALTAGKSNSSRTTIGKGFRLSLQQTVLPSTKYGLSGKEAEEEPYVYTDADGTEHFFAKETEDGKTVYKDQEGLGLTLKTKNDINESGIIATYQITDKAHNNYFFNSEGNLGIIQDKNGNRITIDFVASSENDNFRSKTRISKITDGAGHTFSFDYYDTTTGNYVKTITDNAGRTITFTTEDGHLKSVAYPDGTKSIIGYEYDYGGTTTDEGLINFINDNGVYGLNFNYSSKATGRQVKTVKEWCSPDYNSSTKKYESFTSGQLVSFNRSQYNTTVVRSCGMDGTHGNDDDIVTTIQFDNTGRPTSQQVSLGDGSHSVAGAYNYTSESSSLASQNKITSSAGLGKNTVNYVKSSNAESFTGWNENYSSGSGGKAESVSTEAYIGKKSIKLSTSSVPESGNGVWAYQDISGLRGGKTYTLSAYVKVTAFGNAINHKYLGASIAISSRGSANNKTVFSEYITNVTPTAVDNGWRRLSIKLTLPDDSTEARIFLELRSFVGTAYFDCIQFEYGTTENSYNLLENSSFEKYNEDGRVPTGWTAFGKTDADITTATRHLNGDYSFKMYGEPDLSKGVAQYPVVYGKPEDTYIVSGWAMATAINSTYHVTKDDNDTEDEEDDKYIDRALFEIEVKVYYDDGKGGTYEEEKPTAKFNTTIEGWQYAVQAFSLKSTKYPDYQPTQIRIMPRYNRQDNVAYFDHIQLIKDAAPTCTYDDEGNVISLSENSEQNINAEYDDKDNLTSYTDAVGNKTTLKYDSKNNLTITTSPKKVYGESFYNSTGNVIAQETRSAYSSENAALVIRSETEYSDASSSNGIKANAYVKSTSDEHGNKTNYTFDWATGKPKTVTNANGNVTTYGYTDNKYHTLETVTAHNSKVKYTYDGNQLKQILFSNTGNTDSEKYSFEYDNFGNPKITKVGSQILSTNTYDTNNGALKSTKYGNEDKIENKYDEFGNLKKVIATPSGKSANTRYTWAYNSAGVTTIHRDYENGRRYFYRYDSLGRLINQEIRTNDESNHTHIGSISYEYDLRNNLTKLGFEIGNKSVPQPTYFYGETKDKNGNVIDGSANAGKDNLITRYKISTSRYVDYQYDGLNRLQNKKLSTDTPFLIDYQYKGSNRNTGNVDKYKTTQLASETLGTTKYSYTYDSIGNITAIKKNDSAYSSYTYDELSQLTRENLAGKKTSVWEYDELGNITARKDYAYTTGAVGTETKTVKYYYPNEDIPYEDGTKKLTSSSWNNLLLAVDTDGNSKISDTEKISYDKIGNAVEYLDHDMSWFGRQLETITVNANTTDTTDDKTISFKYGADGLRRTKSVTTGNSTVTSEYVYANDLLIYEKRGNKELYFYYDGLGHLTAVRYYSSASSTSYKQYYVATNLAGDVLAFVNGDGNVVASYEYDAWGNCKVVNDTTSVKISNLNPIRYRGYYLDSETGYYYLQSRYYDPSVGRFLNADDVEFLGADGTPLSYNLFAYCQNNPVNLSDQTGCLPNWAKKAIAAVAIVAVVATVAAVTVATAGAGTAAAVIAIGAAKGAAIGMASGAAIGAATGAVGHRVSTGSWSGAGTSALNGMGDGALSGAITGAITGAASSAVKVLQAAKAWDKGTFDSGYQSMKYHYNEHVTKVGLTKGNNVLKYTQDAVGFANRNSSVLKYTYNYKYGNASWNFTYSTGQGGMFTSTGKILTFWYR